MSRTTALAAIAVLLVTARPAGGQEPVHWADLDRALAEADTFVFLMNGEPFGIQAVLLVRTDDGLRFEETSALGQQMTQTTEVVLAGDPVAMRTVRQTGSVMGRDTRISVDYGAARATGSALTPAAGPTEVAIDAVIPAGVIDDNVLTALLPAIDWTPTTDVLVPIFHSGKNATGEMRLRVTGVESVEVPAGTFDTYRVEASGNDTSVVFYIESGGAHRVVRVEIVGTPMEVVRAR